MLFGLNLLELCELCAGAGYSVQLTFMSEGFLNQTFEGKCVGCPDSQAMTEYGGIFLVGLYGASTIALLNGGAAIKGAIYSVKALTWGLCGLLTLKHWAIAKKPNVYVNMGLQILFTSAFAYSAAVA